MEIFDKAKLRERWEPVEAIDDATRGGLLVVSDGAGTEAMVRIYDATSYVTSCGIDASVVRTMQTAALSHPNVVDLVGIEMVFDNGCSDVSRSECRSAHLVVASEKGRHNLDQWVSGRSQWTGERETVLLLNDVAQGLAYLHRNGYAHPKLSSKNVVIFEQDGVSRARLSDFQDLTIFANEKELLDDDFEEDISCFRAPEILARQSRGSLKADMWTLGVILFQVLFRRTPFSCSDPATSLIQRVTKSRAKKHDTVLSNILSWRSPDEDIEQFSVKRHLLRPDFVELADPSFSQETFVLAVDLIDQCLRLSPDDRITAQAALRHPLFTSFQLTVTSGTAKTTPRRTCIGKKTPLNRSFWRLRADIVGNVVRDVDDQYMEYDAALMGVTLFDRVAPSLWHKMAAREELDAPLVRHLFCACYLLGLKLLSTRTSEDAFACLHGVICAHDEASRVRVAQLERFIVVELGCLLYPSCILRTRPPLQSLIHRASIV
jgi:serine/threonine protein kinase